MGDDLFIKILTDRYKNKFICSYRNKYLTEYNDNIIVYNNFFISLKYKFFKKFLKRNIVFEVFDYKKNDTDVMVHIGGSIFMENSSIKYYENLYQNYNRINKPYYIGGSSEIILYDYISIEDLNYNLALYTESKNVVLIKENLYYLEIIQKV